MEAPLHKIEELSPQRNTTCWLEIMNGHLPIALFQVVVQQES